MQKSSIGNYVDISSYTQSNPYITPSDGYVSIVAKSTMNAYIEVYIGSKFVLSANVSRDGNKNGYNAIYVRKGTKVSLKARTGTDDSVLFYPID